MIEIYKDLIMDHGLNPRNKYIMKHYTNFARGFNHFCGDMIIIYINIQNNIVNDISFDGKGCTISIASASLMTNIFKKKGISDIYTVYQYFQNVIRKETETDDIYQDINVLANVRDFPSRVKCATLAWHTLNNAINNIKEDK